MDKKLPSVFANPLHKSINNSQKETKVVKEIINSNNDYQTIDTKITRIFNSPNYIYKSKVLITDESGTSEKIIVGKTSSALITKDNELINISKIKDIKVL